MGNKGAADRFNIGPKWRTEAYQTADAEPTTFHPVPDLFKIPSEQFA